MSEIQGWNDAELAQKIQEARLALFRERVKHGRRQLENTAILRRLRREIAKMLTVQGERMKGKRHE